MFKWFFILLIIFLISWSFGRNYLPESMLNSKYGILAQDILFPLSKRADNIVGAEMKYESSIIKLDSGQFSKIIDSINSANKSAVIYFLNPTDYSSRFILRDINQLALDKAESNMVFFIAAFDDDVKNFSLLINDFEKLGFRPILVDKSQIKVAEYAFIKNNIKLSGIPAIVFKSESRIYESIATDLGAIDRINYLIENKQ